MALFFAVNNATAAWLGYYMSPYYECRTSGSSSIFPRVLSVNIFDNRKAAEVYLGGSGWINARMTYFSEARKELRFSYGPSSKEIKIDLLKKYYLNHNINLKQDWLNQIIATGSCVQQMALDNWGDDMLCKRATFAAGSKRRWEERSFFKPHVVEAKKRGLSCGVETLSQKPIVETKVPKVVPSVVPKKKLKTTIKSSISLIDPLHIENYGKAYYTPLLPNVIFFIGEIEANDQRGFRRALRSHEVDTVVLISKGGLISEGLALANIIYDNKLLTYVPSGETCASACSFMFFAGNPKVAHGRLGVHQFYVEDDKQKVAVGKVQRGTQLLVSDIIQNLTDFGTPPSVFAKMFATSGMYFFSEEEKSDFSNSNKLNPETVTRINEVLSYFVKIADDALDDVALNGMPQDVKNSLIQLELLRIGCMQGFIDGIQGEATKTAMQKLSSKIGTNLSEGKFSNLLRNLNNTKVGSCY